MRNVDDLSKSMKLVENEYELIKEQGHAARKIVEENYTWQKTCDKYLEMVKTF